jgi:hypothetical protein
VVAWLPKLLATPMDISFFSAMSLDRSTSQTISRTQKHSNHPDWSQKPMGWARARTHVDKAAFWKFVIGFDTLVRDDPIPDYFVLYNTPPFDITTNDFNDGSLKLKYVVNIEQWKNSVWVIRQAQWVNIPLQWFPNILSTCAQKREQISHNLSV